MSILTQLNIDPVTKKNVENWLSSDFDSKTKEEIVRMAQDDLDSLINAFYTTMSFGTGGLRGLMGVGCNRMNNYTVSFATQGLANYLKKCFPDEEISCFIGYDSREHSREFAETAAKVLAGNAIRVHLSSELCPTPFTSFACRELKCHAAVMVTASHNPKEYNGYKVYWSDGGQVLPPHDIGIVEEANEIVTPAQVNRVNSIHHPLITETFEKEKKAYIDAVRKLQIFPEVNALEGKDIHIVYSNLHGTGITLVPDLLFDWGFTHLSYVESQKEPDGRFPTVAFPNPEEPKTMELGVDLLKKLKADLFIATDPDADRMRAIIFHDGKDHWLNGNQIACIMLYHILKSLKKKGTLPENAAFIKTIVTTELFRKITEGFQRPTYDVLTGFKYIAEMIHLWKQDPTGPQYLFGGEESYGTLFGTVARDKDAVLATALFAEATLHAKREGKTIIDLLNDIYAQFGVYGEALVSLNFPETKEGKEKILSIMQTLRTNPPTSLLNTPVIAINDYQTSKSLSLLTRQSTPITLPTSNVIQLLLQDGSKVVVRPSGTEPKMKLYGETLLPPSPTALTDATTKCQQLLATLKEHLLS